MASFLPVIKTRREPTSVPYVVEQRTGGSVPWGPRPPIQGWIDEECVSQCHNGTWPPPYGSKTDIGGQFFLKRTLTDYPVVSQINAFHTRGTTVTLGLNNYTNGIGVVDPSEIIDLNTFGTSAIARVLPTNPASSLTTALGELKKDGVPSLPGASMRDRADFARSSGNEYLNIEFGWLPLIRDLQDFARTVKRARVLIDQYRRDSDRKIRRRFEPAEIELGTTVRNGGFGFRGYNLTGTGTLTRRDSVRYWFSGAFRYHIPVGDDTYSRLLRYESYASRLFDTRLTPELLWNLAPWSWAVDWFTNAGDVIHNISRLGPDGLVMQYGYAMRHAMTSEHHKGRYSKTDPYGTHTGNCELLVSTEYKARVRAHPYGFGITDTSLTARQAAILAALGLTRGQRSP